MTKEEAKQQLEPFFRKLGIRPSFFDDKNFAKANIGEAILGFEFSDAEKILKAKVLIYCFRGQPAPVILEGIKAEENEQNTGGGEIFFDEQSLALSLVKDFDKELVDKVFYDQLNNLAQASLIWSSSILQEVAEKVQGG